MKPSLHRPLLLALTACAVVLGLAAPAACAPNMVGTYVLEGQRETVASLRLESDGRFQMAMSYGAVDTDAQGRWELSGERGDRLVLTTDTPGEPSFAWAEDQAALAERCMGGYGNPGQPPLALVACVSTPDAGLVWENMQVTAHFSNGMSRSGLTTRHGQLGFLARPEPQWKGAIVERLTVSYPRGAVPAQTFAVPPGARTAVIQFDPGRLTAPPAERITFAVKHSGAEAATLELLAPDGSSIGTFRPR